jgi:hypothetical protein
MRDMGGTKDMRGMDSRGQMRDLKDKRCRRAMSEMRYV